MSVNLIYAASENNVIGSNNTLPWHLPEDLKHFKQATLGGVVVMGRKTWESLPIEVRPLPGRQCIVVTRNLDYNAPGATICTDPKTLFEHWQTSNAPLWVIGGAELYAQALPYATEIVKTVVHTRVSGDAFAPEIPGETFKLVAKERHLSKTGLEFTREFWLSGRINVIQTKDYSHENGS